jgi:Nuclease-related domain
VTEIETAQAGASAQREYERRVAQRERRIQERYGTGLFGKFVTLVSDEPAATTAWRTGAEGERRLARRLNAAVGERGVVLHDRRVPGTNGNVDHLVVAATGVWVIDAKTWSGKVECRDVGGWFRTDERLFVGGRDRSKAVEGMAWQVDTVRLGLGALASDDVPIRPTLCFVGAEWGWFARPFTVGGVRVIWPQELCDVIAAGGWLGPERIEELAQRLSEALRPNLR